MARKKENQQFPQLSKEPFKQLMLSVMIGSFIQSYMAESEEDALAFEKQVDLMVNLAQTLGYDGLIEYQDNYKLPANDLCLQEDAILEAYNDENFWETLEIRLGKRDFFREASAQEIKELKKQFWFPEKIHEYYEKYRKEFEKHGIARLEIAGTKIK